MKLYSATIIITESHWDESVSYIEDRKYSVDGMFNLQDLAATYGGAWALDRDRWSGSKVTFNAAIRSGVSLMTSAPDGTLLSNGR